MPERQRKPDHLLPKRLRKDPTTTSGTPYNPDYNPDGGKYFMVEVLRSEAMRSKIATAMWAQRMENHGMQAAGMKEKIRKGLDEILDNVIIYLEDS